MLSDTSSRPLQQLLGTEAEDMEAASLQPFLLRSILLGPLPRAAPGYSPDVRGRELRGARAPRSATNVSDDTSL
jgi:hypothetical protein